MPHTHTHTHRFTNIQYYEMFYYFHTRSYILTYLSVNALFMNACMHVWIDFVTRVHSPFWVLKSEDCVRLSDGYERHVNKLVRRRLVCVRACMCMCVCARAARPVLLLNVKKKSAQVVMKKGQYCAQKNKKLTVTAPPLFKKLCNFFTLSN